MKFDNTHTQALKDFVIHLLRNCPGNSADEDILADYVIALLKYDKPRPELRRLCSSQLDDFLKEETQPFVTKLFQALSTEEYLGGNKPTASGSRTSRESVEAPEINNNNNNGTEHSRPRPVNGSSQEDESLNRRRQEKSPDASLLHPPTAPAANRRSASPRTKIVPTTQETDFEMQDEETAALVDEKTVAAKRRRPEEFGGGPQSEEQSSRASKMQRPSLPVQNPPAGPRLGSSSSSSQQGHHQNYGPSAQQQQQQQQHRRPDNMPMGGRGGDHMGPVRPMHPIQGRGMNHPQWSHGGPNVNVPGQQRIPQAPRGMTAGTMGHTHSQDQHQHPHPHQHQPRGSGRKPRCRDYEERGFCIRGETCPFDHGQDRIIDDASLPRPMNYNPAAFQNMPGMLGNMRPPFFVPMAGAPFEGMMGRVPMAVGPDGAMQAAAARGPVPGPLTPPQPFGSARGGIRGGTGFRGNGRGRGGRGGWTGSRANFHTQKGFTLLVENIPENHCAIDKVNDFFKKFGTVTNIQVDPQNSKALVQFSNNAEAYKAYSSAEPIFDNRFVKVFWHEKEKETVPGENPQSSSSVPGSSDVTGPAATVAAHAAHLAEMNAAREEKARARKEQMEKMMEVQKQKEALIQKQIEEQKLLMEAMSKNLNIPEKEKAELMRRLESVANSVLPATTTTTTTTSNHFGTLSTKPPSAKFAEEKERERLDRELDLLSKMGDKGPQNSSPEVTEALQAKLDQLKAEAASLGVGEHSFRGRGGGYRARGRGSWAPRGRGGASGAAGFKPYSLDLRPTKLLIKSVPASVQPKLKEHFERYGDVESVSLDGGTGNAIVHYKTRHEAEKAFYNGGKFEELSEKLEMSWYQDGVPTNPTPVSIRPNNPNTTGPVPASSSSSSSQVHMEDVRMRSDANAESDEDDEDGERNWKRGI